MKLTVLLLSATLCLCSCSIPKLDRIHVISEQQCYKLKTSLYSAGFYVYANGKRYRRYDVISLTENEKCPYCEKGVSELL